LTWGNAKLKIITPKEPLSWAGLFKWQKADLRLAIEVGPAVVPGVVLSLILARRVVVISEHRRRAWRCRAKPALQNVLIAGLAMASLPTIVFFHPGAVPESNGRMAAPHLFAARRCDSDATASRAGTSLKKPEATIRALPSGAGQQGGARSLSICFGEGSG
jgi:hypothetical protein